jgi:cobalt-zinc-cadmium efflux system outer membrane protein
MSFRTNTAALAALVALVAGPTAGATPPSAPPGALAADAAQKESAAGGGESDRLLDGLVAEAFAANPDILAIAEAVAAAKERPEQVRARPDPGLSLQYTNDGWSPSLGTMPMTNLALMGSQTLSWPGKRRLRAAVAEADAASTDEALERARLTLAAEVKRAFWGLALARETFTLLTEQKTIGQDAEAVARARYVVGQGTQQDVLRAQVEISRYEQQRVEQEATVAIRTAELNRLLNRAVGSAPPPTPRLELRPRPASFEALWAVSERLSPELRAAAVAADRERFALQLAHKDFKPDFTVQAGYMNRGGLDPMWQASVGVNLPVYRARRQAAVAEAEARGREAERRTEALRAQLRYRTEERLAQLGAAEALYKLSANAVVPQARLAYEASIASYQAGKAAFLAVLEALSSLYSDRLTQLRLVAAHERIKAAIDEVSLEPASELPSVAGSPMDGPPGRPASPTTTTSSPNTPAAPTAAGAMGPMGQ